jgi:dethiobiotin synthetase
MKQGIFITGTDTGVGKTIVTTVILSILRKAGIDAVPMKPVQTGCRRRSGKLVVPDLESILRLVGIRTTNAEKELMCPFKYMPACSPHLAASITGRRISLNKILQCFRRLSNRHQVVVVEGAGGVLVPLDRKKTMVDLMKLLGLPVILVARPGLGTINHTLLSARELKRAGLKLKGVIFNQAEPGQPGFIEKDNFKTIPAIGRIKVLGFVPFVSGLKQPGTRRRRSGRTASVLRGRAPARRL